MKVQSILKRTLPVLLAIAMILAFAGCGAKTAITAKDFNDKIEAKEFTVTDATNQVQEGTVTAISMASKPDNSYQIEFYEFPSAEAALSTFTGNKEMASSTYKGTTSEKSTETWNNFSITTDTEYIYMESIGNTFIYVKADSSYKKEITSIVKSLGY